MIEASDASIEPLLQSLERCGYRTIHWRVGDPAQLIDALKSGAWDLILCGDGATELDPLVALGLLEARDLDIPLVAIAAEVAHDRAVELAAAGAAGALQWDDLAGLEIIVEREIGAALRRRVQRAKLVQATRKASMSMLASGVVHEVNNPLSYILFNVEGVMEDMAALLKGAAGCREALAAQAGERAALVALGEDAADLLEPGMPEETLETAQEALDGAGRVKDIMSGLGSFSRMEMDDPGPVDLRAPIECAYVMAYNQLKFRAQVVKELQEVPRITAPEGKLSHLFINLMINASQAIDEGDVANNEIRIRTWAGEDLVYVEVKDTGRGMEPEQVERAFDPSYSTRPANEGGGMGLSVCRDIVADLGGEIQLNSEPGTGTAVLITLPTPEEVARRASADAEEIGHGQGRVLVVDDDPSIRSILRRILVDDHEVTLAASGEAAKELILAQEPFDVVLCDLMMSHCDGIDFHRWLVEQDPGLARRTVFVSGGIFTPRSSEYLATVGNLKVEKPFDSKVIRKIVSNLLAQARR